jgi:RNA-binding protein YhbY
MKPIKTLQLGKQGITENFKEQLKQQFTNARTVKITILKSACRNKEEAKNIAEQLTKELGPTYNYKLIGYVLTIMKFRKTQR